MINEYSIWVNLKAYIYNFGECLLDNILCINDPQEATDYSIRYSDFDELRHHFELEGYSTTRVEEWKYPFISVYFVTEFTEECDIRTRIGFNVAFHNVSPAGCDRCGRCVGNSPEAMLQFKDNVTNAILAMFDFSEVDEFGHISQSNFAKFLIGKTIASPDSNTPVEWERKMNVYKVGNPSVSGLRSTDEISEFNIELDIVASSLKC